MRLSVKELQDLIFEVYLEEKNRILQRDSALRNAETLINEAANKPKENCLSTNTIKPLSKSR